jgi:hypothetical protein
LNSGKAAESAVIEVVSSPRKKKDKPKDPEVIALLMASALPKIADIYQCIPWRRIDATMRTKPVARCVPGTPLDQSSATVNA